MKKLTEALVLCGGMALIYVTGRVSGVIECTVGTDKALKEHGLTVRDVTWSPFKGRADVTVVKLNKEKDSV